MKFQLDQLALQPQSMETRVVKIRTACVQVSRNAQHQTILQNAAAVVVAPPINAGQARLVRLQQLSQLPITVLVFLIVPLTLTKQSRT
mmetsp:Transcript_124784/g.221097  ORF Transcript_124784/g.221097 Transcript_124784/m.221097 type:complete len:88 (+) Transcript_124784:1239-1502(+)